MRPECHQEHCSPLSDPGWLRPLGPLTPTGLREEGRSLSAESLEGNPVLASKPSCDIAGAFCLIAVLCPAGLFHTGTLQYANSVTFPSSPVPHVKLFALPCIQSSQQIPLSPPSKEIQNLHRSPPQSPRSLTRIIERASLLVSRLPLLLHHHCSQKAG